MKKTYALVLLVVFASASSFDVYGQTEPRTPQTEDGPWARLDALKSENALLTEQLKNAELKKRIAEDIAATSAQVSGVAPSVVPGGNVVPTRSTMVEMVSNSPKINDGKLSALLQLSSGGQLTVTVGSKVPDLGKITSISIHEVLAESGGHIVSIPFALDQGTDVAAGFSGAR